MKKLALLSLIALTLNTFSARANGGPVAELSAMTLSRAPMMRHCPEVQLLREEARFTPDERYTQVEVRYTLHNCSGKALDNIWYGFPIDWYDRLPGSDRGWATRQPFVDDYGQEVGWHDHYVQDVMFFLNGEGLYHQHSKDSVLRYGHPLPESMYENGEPNELWDSVERAGGFYTVECNLMRRWYYTTLSLGADEVAELTVKYVVFNHVDLYNEIPTIFYPEHNVCLFEYDFSPASYWGNGRAGELLIEVDTAKLRGMDSHLGFSEHYPMQNLRDTRWSLLLKDIDLAQADPFHMVYPWEPEGWTVGELLSMRLSPTMYSVELSGVDRRYPAANLSDLDLRTATVIRPDKDGKLHITLKMNEPTIIRGVIVVGGYAKDSATWHNNSRIGKISIPQSVYGHGGQDGVQTPKSFDWQGVLDASIRKATSFLPYNINEVTPYEYIERLELFDELNFDITQVIPGAKYDDLCISEIIVLGAPKKKMQ